MRSRADHCHRDGRRDGRPRNLFDPLAATPSRRKDLTVVLVSGVFIILSATAQLGRGQEFQFRFLIFLLLLFVVRR